MDIEFHYYISFMLAQRAGFNDADAEIMAYSNQYVDDNTRHYYVNYKDGGHYISEVSQTMDISKPSQKRQTIYPLFHFIPAFPDEVPEERVMEPYAHSFNTAPNSRNAQKLLRLAMASENPYLMGVATHAYADTWSHQSFVGLKHPFNRKPGVSGSIIPNICHADFLHDPDTVGLQWADPRLRHSRIDNNERFMEAAECIFKAYGEHNKMPEDRLDDEWKTLKQLLSAATKRETFEDEPPSPYPTGVEPAQGRKNAYLDICPGIPNYDKKRWWAEAIHELEYEDDIFDRFWAKEDFASSHWFKFQEAVKQHRGNALNMFADLYRTLNLPTNWTA
ncbi:MAG: hypothetical protein HY788_15955 [Deltaproteobacteria bacterium]|nr:hypothetical protein [Deltaproteobacteria bacterium]